MACPGLIDHGRRQKIQMAPIWGNGIRHRHHCGLSHRVFNHHQASLVTHQSRASATVFQIAPVGQDLHYGVNSVRRVSGIHMIQSPMAYLLPQSIDHAVQANPALTSLHPYPHRFRHNGIRDQPSQRLVSVEADQANLRAIARSTRLTVLPQSRHTALQILRLIELACACPP